MKDCYWLDDDAWAKIEPHLPQGRRGAHRVDDRRVISGIIHMLRTGARWRDCPPAYGPYTTIYNRYRRWSQQGVWYVVVQALTGRGGAGPIEATHLNANHVAAGARDWPFTQRITHFARRTRPEAAPRPLLSWIKPSPASRVRPVLAAGKEVTHSEQDD